MIVVDTNVLAYLFLEGEHTHEAEQVLKIDPDWVSTRLWRSEFRSVLALCLRKKTVSLDQALKIAQTAELFMKGKEYEPFSPDILRLVSDSPCSAYDCEFVALAQTFNAPLVTSDEQLLKHFPSTAVSLKTFASKTS